MTRLCCNASHLPPRHRHQRAARAGMGGHGMRLCSCQHSFGMVLGSFALHALRRCARGGQGIPRRGPPPLISAAGVGSSPAPAPAGRARVRAGPGMRSRTCHVRSCYSVFVCGVLHVSVGADTASAWRRPNVLWALDLHTVYRGDATERRHSACPPNHTTGSRHWNQICTGW